MIEVIASVCLVVTTAATTAVKVSEIRKAKAEIAKIEAETRRLNEQG